MNLTNSYLTIPDPLAALDRWLNAYSQQQIVTLNNKVIEVNWTNRAEKALNSRSQPLIVEMQLYFSCVVKKRVLFHEHADLASVAAVSDRLKVCFRAIQSADCDPQTFARDYPEQRELDSKAAASMQPSILSIDFKHGRWQGDTGFATPRAGT